MLEHLLERFYLERLQKPDFEIGMPEYDTALSQYRAIEGALSEQQESLIFDLEDAHNALVDYRSADAFAEGFRTHRLFALSGAGF